MELERWGLKRKKKKKKKKIRGVERDPFVIPIRLRGGGNGNR